MTKIALEELLRRYLENETTPLESAYVEKWYETSKEISPEEIDVSDEIKDEIFKEIRKRLPIQKTQRSRIIQWGTRAAAVFVLFLGLALVYRHYFYERSQHTTTLVPGTDKAILKLADGTVIELDKKQNGSLANEGGATITKTDSGTIAYTTVNSAESVRYNEIYVPTGGQYQLQLPDGTKIWLNSLTTLKFPTRFTGNERKVTVTGEAYFEVAKNKKMPFVVEVPGKQNITVLGTHFNVAAYIDENEVRTTLAEGSVKVDELSGTHQQVILKPGQQAIVIAGQVIQKDSDVNLDQVIAWKNGFFSFDKTNISDIARQFSRWYGATVLVEPGISHTTFSGKIPRDMDITQVLHILEKTNTLRFSMHGDQIRIFSTK